MIDIISLERLALPKLDLEYPEFIDLCEVLSDQVETYCQETGESFDKLIVLPRGSFLVAEIMSHSLGFDALEIASQSLSSYELDETEAGEMRRGQTLTADLVEGLDLLVVDDTSDTDETLEEFRGIAFDLGARSVKSAVTIYKSGRNTTGNKPDFYVYEYDGWIKFPSEKFDKKGKMSVVSRSNRARLEAERRASSVSV